MDSQGSSDSPSASQRLHAVLERLGALTDWERRGRRAGMRVDTAPIEALAAALGHPERGGRSIHVAGSKGKGSTCAWLAAALRAAGWRTGRYGSPHLESVTERVVIDGVQDGAGPLAEALERVLPEVERCAGAATWFDVLTAAAWLRFEQERCDWRVVEVGLGGRLDSTNALQPELCLITSIELEHTEILGDTREAIAAEKAGILKPGVPAIAALAPGDPAGGVVSEIALRVGAPLILAPPEPGLGIAARNRALAGRALDELGRRGWVSAAGASLDAGLLEALEPPRLPGRMERGWVGGVPVVLDGAHTPDSVGLLRADLEGAGELPGAPEVVLALGADKDVEGVLKVLAGWADRVHCSSAGPRACAPLGVLAETAHALGLEAETASNPREAFQRALERSTDRWVLVTGSLHLCAALRSQVQPRKAPCSRSSPTSS